MNRSRRLLAAAVTVAAVLGAVAFASAASLPVAPGVMTSTTAANPWTATATATNPSVSGSTTTVSLTVPAAYVIVPRTVQVTVVDSGGAHSSASVTLSSAAQPITLLPAYTPAAVLSISVTLDGWNLPTTWSFTPPAGPVYPGNAGTVTSNLVWTLVTNNPVQVCFVVDVTTTSTTPVVWRLTLDLAQAPFNGQTTGYGFQGSDGWRYEEYASTPSAGYLQIGGKVDASAGRRTVVAGQTYQVSVCNWGLPPGVQTPSAYAVTTVQSTWTDARACLVTTVTGNGSSPFYFGWTVPLNMQSAVSRLQSAGRTFDAFTYSTNHSQQTWTPAPDIGPYAYRVVSNTAANITGTESYVFETCAVHW